MTKELMIVFYGIALFVILFLQIYSLFYAGEVKKAERQMGIDTPSWVKTLLTITTAFPLIAFVIIAIFFLFTFFADITPL